MTYWEQECPNISLHERLTSITNNDDVKISSDDKELFRTLKRHLTRKELHAFCMREGGKNNQEIAERVGVKPEETDLLLRKALRKIKHSKVTAEIFIKNEERSKNSPSAEKPFSE
jgi:transcriptional regulator